MAQLTKYNAKRIIEALGGTGQPPPYFLSELTVGLEGYLSTIKEEYFDDYIKFGGSTFKLVLGAYGSGKTHFLYSVRELAWSCNYATSYVTLTSSSGLPFYKLEGIYKAIADGLIPPTSPEKILAEENAQGIIDFLKFWYYQQSQKYQTLELEYPDQEIAEDIRQISGIKSTSFENAIRHALRAIQDNRDEDLRNIGAWLKGEPLDLKCRRQYGIQQKLDKSTALDMIQSLVQTVQKFGYSGLVLLLDEAELSTSIPSKEKNQYVRNLRQLVDDCAESRIHGLAVFYAVPDLNFLDGQTGDYEALKMRFETIFEGMSSPRGVRIMLENQDENTEIALLVEAGMKICRVYEIAYNALDSDMCKELIDLVAPVAYDQRYGGGYKRLFSQAIIRGFDYIRSHKNVSSLEDLRLFSE